MGLESCDWRMENQVTFPMASDQVAFGMVGRLGKETHPLFSTCALTMLILMPSHYSILHTL